MENDDVEITGASSAEILGRGAQVDDHDHHNDLPHHSSEPLMVAPNDDNDSNNSNSLYRFPYFHSSDFRELIACVVFCLACMVAFLVRADPLQRPIPYQRLETDEFVLYVRNLSIDEVFDGDTVSDTLGAVLGVVLPLLAQLLLAKWYKLRGDAHATICVYLVALGITMLTTYAVKMYAGYLRPIFYDLCQPSDDFSECTADEEDGACETNVAFCLQFQSRLVHVYSHI